MPEGPILGPSLFNMFLCVLFFMMDETDLETDHADDKTDHADETDHTDDNTLHRTVNN